MVCPYGWQVMVSGVFEGVMGKLKVLRMMYQDIYYDVFITSFGETDALIFCYLQLIG